MSLDWNKPIQFENGRPCNLLDTCPSDDVNEYTRVIYRSDEENVYTNIWLFREDGKSKIPGYSIVNQ